MSEAEFTDFVAHRSPALLRTAYLLCGGDKGAAEDLLQEVLERVFPRWRRIRDRPEPYVRAALANAATNRWRHKARRVAEAPLDRDMPHPHLAGPEQGIANRELVVKALGALPPKMRAVIVLRFFDDLSEADTAAAMNCGIGTVKSQTSRGLVRLREVIDAATAEEPHHTSRSF